MTALLAVLLLALPPLPPGPFAVEDLGPVVASATLESRLMFTDPQGDPHLLLYYILPAYGARPMELLDLNLQTGEQRLVDTVIGRPGPSATTPHRNGKLYFATGDPGYAGVYDPATGQARPLGKFSDRNIQFAVEGDDGGVYFGSVPHGHVYRLDVVTEQLEDYGIIDDPGPPYYRYAYTLGADQRYVYVGIGQNPWYLAVYDKQTRQTRTFWKDLPTGSITVARGVAGGWYAEVRGQGPAAGRWKLVDGEPRERVTDAVEPWYQRGSLVRDPAEFERLFPYQLDLSEAVADSATSGRATVRWRAKDAAAWRAVSYEVHLGPAVIKRLYPTPDGKLLGFSASYGPVFIWDPATERPTVLGRPMMSVFDAAPGADGNWYLAGYTALSMVYDPRRPWTLSPATVDRAALDVNPRTLPLHLGKDHLYHAVTPDGTVFAGVHHERDSTGGNLGWVAPATGQSGHLREPFVEYEPTDLITADHGRLVVMSTAARQAGESGKLFIVDAATKQLLRAFAPLPGSDAGKVTEVAPGEVVGIVKGTPHSRVYRANVTTGQTLWDKELPGIAFGALRGYDRRVALGPDGGLWFYRDDGLTRLDPADGAASRVCAAPLTNPVFLGRDLYLYGDTNLRRVRAVAP